MWPSLELRLGQHSISLHTSEFCLVTFTHSSLSRPGCNIIDPSLLLGFAAGEAAHQPAERARNEESRLWRVLHSNLHPLAIHPLHGNVESNLLSLSLSLFVYTVVTNLRPSSPSSWVSN